MYCIYRTCPGEVRLALGAVADPSLGGDVQDVERSTRQIGDVTAVVRRGAAAGVSVELLQSGRVRHRTANGGPGDAHCGVVAAHGIQHVPGGTGSWGRRNHF